MFIKILIHNKNQKECGLHHTLFVGLISNPHFKLTRAIEPANPVAHDCYSLIKIEVHHKTGDVPAVAAQDLKVILFIVHVRLDLHIGVLVHAILDDIHFILPFAKSNAELVLILSLLLCRKNNPVSFGQRIRCSHRHVLYSFSFVGRFG